MVPAHKARAHTMQGQQVHLLGVLTTTKLMVGRCTAPQSLPPAMILQIATRTSGWLANAKRRRARWIDIKIASSLIASSLSTRPRPGALPLRPKPRALSPQPASRSCCSIALSRFLRARSMAPASFGEILPVVMSVSILL